MRFARSIPLTDKGLRIQLLSSGWKRIKEPANLRAATLLSLPFAFILGAITLAITYGLDPSIYAFLRDGQRFSVTIPFNLSTLLFILAAPLFISAHELIHAAFIPNVMRSDKTFWGINGVFGFVFTTEEIEKGRFLIISIMPYLILSVMLPYILSIFSWLNGYTIFLCLLNAMGSCVDFLNAGLIVIQVPSGATIVNNGFETYYKATVPPSPAGGI
ncbi:DUF3267 domain-containing protein [Methanoculleus palmolei]|jgi:hypothetical protein|uniref:DUF3267 domain-containing protein n=1 Tax=Methanoculleus palmolei TaxID=72612 RepID=A0ABD8A7A7_9EURY|nr:DUF3267 domain-containing protein [Methanoculleus palmolei]